MAKPKNAITPSRSDDFPEWYQQVVKASDLAENSEVRGCMVIKPWGYGLWEQIQSQLDKMFKDTGHKNAYFPLLIPLSYLEKEAEHAEDENWESGSKKKRHTPRHEDVAEEVRSARYLTKISKMKKDGEERKDIHIHSICEEDHAKLPKY